MTHSEIESALSDISAFAFTKKSAEMKEYTTFKTGGTADILAYPRSIEGASAVVRYAHEQNIPLTVIGGGSNLIVSDSGIRGIVIRMAEDDVHTGAIEIRGEGIIYADAIARKRDFIEFAVSHGYSGTKFMAGIPGCIGGGIRMNAGTFMGTFIDILDRVCYVDYSGNVKEVVLTKSMAHYRGIDIDDALVIYGAYFSLPEKEDVAVLRREIDEIAADRKLKHPQDPSAGSVFKNPDGHFSWKLVNDAGLKGKKIGGAMVSNLHTNFIVNAGDATSSDIRDLIGFVRSTVKDKFGVELNTEVRFVGEF